MFAVVEDATASTTTPRRRKVTREARQYWQGSMRRSSAPLQALQTRDQRVPLGFITYENGSLASLPPMGHMVVDLSTVSIASLNRAFFDSEGTTVQLKAPEVHALSDEEAEDDVVTSETGEASSDQVYESVKVLDRSGEGRKAARVLLHHIERSFADRNFEAINCLLREFNPKDVSEWPAVALLRSTYRASNMLPAWGDALAAARREFDERRLNSKRLLVGLQPEA